jgi:hypothetical protein
MPYSIRARWMIRLPSRRLQPQVANQAQQRIRMQPQDFCRVHIVPMCLFEGIENELLLTLFDSTVIFRGQARSRRRGFQ